MHELDNMLNKGKACKGYAEIIHNHFGTRLVRYHYGQTTIDLQLLRWGIYRSSVHEFRLHNAAIQSRDCVAVLHILEIALPPCVISRLVLKLRIPNVDCVIQSGDCFKIASYLRSDFLFLSKHVVLGTFCSPGF